MKQRTAKQLYITSAIFLVIAIGVFGLTAMYGMKKDPVVGTWFVKAPDAPFSYHMFSFYADGTMSQANPDAGDTNTSDSDGLGVWRREGDMIKGKFDEITADRTTHNVVARGEISFEFKIKGDSLSGMANADFYDVTNANHLKGPLPTAIEGNRIKP
jgi:hypothetical protein